MSLAMFYGTLELGMIYALLTIGLYISFRVLDTPDMTVDGSFVTGAAISAIFTARSHPYIGLLVAFLAGCIAGGITSLLNTKLKIQSLLAGILSMLALYSINLKIMGNKPNISLLNKVTIFNVFEGSSIYVYSKILILSSILLLVITLLILFLKTEFGFVLRATGNNENMVKALGANPNVSRFVGLAISNGIVALAGALLAQYQMFADIGMGVGTIVVGLASVIIGEVVIGNKTLLRNLLAVTVGAIIYRFIIAFALQLGMPPTDLKLISAIIVAIALSIPTINEKFCKIKNKIFNGNIKRGESVDVENRVG